MDFGPRFDSDGAPSELSADEGSGCGEGLIVESPVATNVSGEEEETMSAVITSVGNRSL